jgi:hypothetical protein
MCILAVLGDTNRESNDYKEKTEIFRKLKSKFGNDKISVGYTDGICYFDTFPLVGINAEHLPTALIIWPKQNKYANLVGKFSLDDIDAFISKAQRDKVSKNNLPAEFEFSNTRDCSEKHKEW